MKLDTGKEIEVEAPVVGEGFKTDTGTSPPVATSLSKISARNAALLMKLVALSIPSQRTTAFGRKPDPDTFK